MKTAMVDTKVGALTAEHIKAMRSASTYYVHMRKDEDTQLILRRDVKGQNGFGDTDVKLTIRFPEAWHGNAGFHGYNWSGNWQALVALLISA
jgi:hypothetical protein